MSKVTPEQIAEWKKKYGDIFQISVDEHSCYLRRPNRKELSYAAVAGKNDPLKYNENILKSCWLGGDEEIRDDDVLFFSAGSVLAEIIEIKAAELKKL
jgi:hypothetical protein